MGALTEAAVFEALKRCATKAGVDVDVDGLKVEGCITDQTWGTRCGYFFYGASDETNRRAAAWFIRHFTRKQLGSSYEAQFSPSTAPEAFTKSVCSNGARHHFRGHTGEGSKVTRYPARDGFEGFDLTTVTTHGYAASYVYYPDAD